MQTQGEKIKALIRRRGLKQKDFAQSLGWNQTAFSKKIHGNTDFSAEKIAAIAEALQVHPDLIASKELEYYSNTDIPGWADMAPNISAPNIEERLKKLEKAVLVGDTAFQGRVLTMLAEILEAVRQNRL